MHPKAWVSGAELAERLGVAGVRLEAPSAEQARSYLEALEEGFMDWPGASPRSLSSRPALAEHLAKLGSGRCWDGSEAETLWLSAGEEFLGRVRLKGLSRPRQDQSWDDPMARVGGNFGYKLRPSATGKGLGKVLAALGLEALAEAGAETGFMGVDESNAPSLACVRACGCEEVGSVRSRWFPNARFILFERSLADLGGGARPGEVEPKLPMR